jgi:hypothetical protein
MYSKQKYITISYDSLCKQQFYRTKLISDIIIGKLTPVTFTNDPTIEQAQMAFQNVDGVYYAIDKSCSQGTYYRIKQNEWVQIEINQYFVFGCTYCTFIKNSDSKFVILLIDKNWKFLQGKVINAENMEFTVGKSIKCHIKIQQDENVSKEHFKFLIKEGKIFIYDNTSSNYVWLKFSKLRLEEEPVQFRIGLTTFLEYSCMDNKLEELECMPNAPITAPRNKAKF